MVFSSHLNQAVPFVFVTIVLNGADFLGHHYSVFEEAASRLGVDFEWHVVEGIAEGRADARNPYSTAPLGGVFGSDSANLSIDGTSKFLDMMSRKHHNVKVHRKLDSPFRDKIEQINAALPHLPESILMQVDADELWSAEAIVKAYQRLASEEEQNCMLFDCHFFVGPGRVVRGGWGHGATEWLRAWKFQPGSFFLSHAPPVLVRPGEGGALEPINNCVSKEETRSLGIGFSHFAYLLESQVQFKEAFYGYDGAVTGWKALQEAQLPVKANEHLPWLRKEARNYEPRFEESFVTHVGDSELTRFFQVVELDATARVDWWIDQDTKGSKCDATVIVDGVAFQMKPEGGIARVWSEVLPKVVGNLKDYCFVYLSRGQEQRPSGIMDWERTRVVSIPPFPEVRACEGGCC